MWVGYSEHENKVLRSKLQAVCGGGGGGGGYSEHENKV